jgi:hypothetical protein
LRSASAPGFAYFDHTPVSKRADPPVGGEQARVVGGLRVRVARGLREVEQRRERVEVRVEDPKPRGEAVEREPHRAAAERDADAGGRRVRERAGRGPATVQQVGAPELRRGAGERLHAPSPATAR